MKNTVLITILILITSIAFAQTNLNKDPEQTSKSISIVFKSQVYDFGTIEYKEEATGEFIFKNVSKKPVILTNVRASCGCTGTDWPREEIKRRKKESIFVTYDTKRVGKFHKNVYVYVDGNKNPIQLEIKGEVLPSKNGNNTSTSKTISPKKVKLNANVKVATPNAKKKEIISNEKGTKNNAIKKQSAVQKQEVKSEKKLAIEKKSYEKKSVKTE